MRLLQLMLIGCSLVAAAVEADTQRSAIVSAVDRVLPDIADGGGISTTITVINLDSKPADYQIQFLDDSGVPFPLPIVQLPGGKKTGVQGVIAVGGSITLDTTGQE